MQNYQTLQKGAKEGVTATYPVTEENIHLKYGGSFVNPMIGDDLGIKIPDDFDQMEGAKEIESVRTQVKNGIYPYDFLNKYYPFKDLFGDLEGGLPEPLLDEGLSVNDVEGLANVVHMDFPDDAPKAIFRYLLRQGYKLKGVTHNHEEYGSFQDFLGTVPGCIENIGDYQKRALHKVFPVKDFFGLGRPEEVLAYNCTAYIEGCPNHGSFPQGHEIAVADPAYDICNMFEGGVKSIKKEHLKVVLNTCYLWGQFRCLAGVHYGIDAIGSLMISKWKKFLDKSVREAYTA